MDPVVLFTPIAEIAGVFVGFAPLIGVTRRSEIGSAQLARIRAVVTTGLVVIVGALVPAALRSSGVADRTLWLVNGAGYLALDLAVIALALRRPESRHLAGAQARATPVVIASFRLLEVAVQLPLVLVVLGVAPGLELAFYLTALVVHLFEATLVLGQLVCSPARRDHA